MHIHLLANIDDGPPDLPGSIAMLDLASQLGYATIVTTPHLIGPLEDEYEYLAATRLKELSPHATTRGIELLSGFEVRLTPDIGRRLRSGEPITLAGSNVVLVELPFSGWPNFTEQALFDIVVAGFVPLLAHPERYEAAVEQPQRIIDLHSRGVLMQLTAGSLTGLFGKRAKELAERMLRAGLVEILASDAHSAGRRYMAVAEGFAHARRIVGPGRVRQLTSDNPMALLSGLSLPAHQPIESTEASDQTRSRPWRLVRSVLPGR